MQIVVDDGLNYDRIDLSTGISGQPVDVYVNLHIGSNDPFKACRALVEKLLDMCGGAECRIQCTAYTIDRNMASIVMTSQGWERWKATIINATSHKALCEQLAADASGTLREFWRTFKAEGETGKYATCDVHFPCGKSIHWSGHA